MHLSDSTLVNAAFLALWSGKLPLFKAFDTGHCIPCFPLQPLKAHHFWFWISPQRTVIEQYLIPWPDFWEGRGFSFLFLNDSQEHSWERKKNRRGIFYMLIAYAMHKITHILQKYHSQNRNDSALHFNTFKNHSKCLTPRGICSQVDTGWQNVGIGSI